MSRRRPPVPNLARRRCFLTGAASGIGRATALAAAGRGAELHLTDRDGEGLAETREMVERQGGRVLRSEVLDVTDHDGVLALAAAIHAEHGSVDVVMNVAGVSTWGTIEALGHEDWEQMIDVDLRGPISVLEAFVPAMIAPGRGGHVVNVSSAAGLLGLPWHAAYSAAKFGLRGVSEVLRFDLRRHRIGVSLVCPGGVATPLVESARIRGVDPEAPELRKLRDRFARHAVSPERVAEKILAGIERDRYLVFTSNDIRLAFLAQRWCPPAYELAMRRLNDRLAATAARAAARAAS
ncbi:MAG TPA: SDR family oxidoreductase [Solirubrobacterales bacterium]|nr:SDR family oxidoreductase [Solirubrobacterales bacterium]